MPFEILPSHTFDEAAELWLKLRTFTSRNSARPTGYIAKRTLKDYGQYAKTISSRLGSVALSEINYDRIRQFQEDRSQTAGANRINSELAVLKRIMKRGGAWTDELDKSYEPLLHEETDIPRAMTQEQQKNFLEVASSRLSWQVVYWYALLAINTTCSNCEMTGLRVGDINLFSHIVRVTTYHAKNAHRVREIPLSNDDAHWACAQLLDRARGLGAQEADHFLFPFRIVRNEFDPTRPMTNSGIKKPFDEVRRAAGVPWLRFHDFRHTGVTRLAEAGTPIPVIMAIAGHISLRMMQHYTHISDQQIKLATARAFGTGIRKSMRREYSRLDERAVVDDTPAAAPALAIALVTSAPVGADIEVDGVFAGNTPSELALDPGMRTLRITREGAAPYERRISVTAGSKLNITATLRSENMGGEHAIQ